MSTIIRVPELGENVESADIVTVLVEVGDTIEEGQPLVEVETDKAAVEIPSESAGVVEEIHVTAGDSVSSGDTLVTLSEHETSPDRAGEDSQETAGGSPPTPAPADDAQSGGRESDVPKPSGPEDGPAEMVVPELGEGVDSVQVVSVLVEVGDTVEIDQPVVEVETDKAALEVPSTLAGTVSEIHVEAGDSLTTGDPIMTVEGGARRAAATPGSSVSASRPTTPGQASDEQASPAEETTGRTGTTPENSETSSTEPRRGGGVAPVRQELQAAGSAPGRPPRLVPAAPSVRRFAREVGLDIATVEGTGPGGRITIEDVKARANRLLQGAATAPGAEAQPELPDFSAWGEVSFEDMSRIRQVTAENMHRAWRTVPQVTHHDRADITDLEALRKRHSQRVEEAGGKLTVTAILVKVLATALKVFPDLNSSLDAQERRIVRKHYVHVGVAVDTPHGLLVPVVRDADHKNITRIAVELGDLAERARSRRLKPDEMQGATFTLSNLGGIGGTGFAPIVFWPQVGILGVSRSSLEPRWREDGFEPRLLLPLSLSYDHRLVDGAQAARFVRWVAEALEDPLLLALEG